MAKGLLRLGRFHCADVGSALHSGNSDRWTDNAADFSSSETGTRQDSLLFPDETLAMTGMKWNW